MKYTLLLSVILLPCILPATLLADDVPREVSAGSGVGAPKQPQLFVSDDATIDIVYATPDEIHLTTSRDRGGHFVAGRGVISCRNMSAGMRRGPRVVRTANTVVVTAIGGKQGKGRDGDLWAWHSADDGQIWSEPVRVNDVEAAAREGLHAMTAGPRGEVWCVWLDLRSGKTEIMASSSTDGGKSWSVNRLVYRSPSGSVCECCHPSVVRRGDNGVAVMFRNSLEGQRDMFVTTSRDGQPFEPAARLGQRHWQLGACPMDGGMLASDGRGRLATVWRREERIFATLGDGSERELGEGQQPWIAWSATGPLIAWTIGREGTLQLMLGPDESPRAFADQARDPVIGASLKHDFAVVCWESRAAGKVELLAQTVSTAKAAAR